jgi:AcrR family transcriptional regulator
LGSAERRAREKENLRRAILDAARELFVTEGYDAVSMRKIAEKIEYSPTTIYLHFKDKDEILLCLSEEGFTLLRACLDKADIPDPVERLRQGGHAYLDFALSQPHYYKIMFEIEANPIVKDEAKREDSVAPRAFGFIRRCVAEGMAQGTFVTREPEPVVSHVIWAHIHGAASLALAGRLGMLPPEAHRAFFQEVIETTIRGLSAGDR